MYLKSLQLANFKNYEDLEIDFIEGINCFVGKNGSGKTNVLDAVHYLSVCKSYLNPIDRQNIHFGSTFFSIRGEWELNQKEVTIHCAVKEGAKKVVRRNKKEYEKLAEHIGQFPVVIISPYDRDLIIEGSEFRRKWIDSIISQFDRNYLDDLQRYGKVLIQRNALLKNMFEHRLFDQESIDVWDHQLIDLGNKIYARRKDFLVEFIPIFQKHYNEIGLVEEQVHLEYRSHLNEGSFSDMLKANARKDAITQFTNVGIHKDDLIFTIKSHPIKKFGSQGQQKSFAIALKLAQYEWLKQHLNVKPVLLLDDIFDKLDEERVGKLMDLVSTDFFNQVLVTDTDETRIRSIMKDNKLPFIIFDVQQGKITKLDSINADERREANVR